MNLDALAKRLDRLEAAGDTAAPVAILSDCLEGLGPEIHLQDWRAWIADGLASVRHGVFTVAGPELILEQWAARFVTAR